MPKGGLVLTHIKFQAAVWGIKSHAERKDERKTRDRVMCPGKMKIRKQEIRKDKISSAS